MNEVFEILSDVFEEMRSEREDREYVIRTKDAKTANRELQKKKKAFEEYLCKQSEENKSFLENYMDAVDHAHYKEEQCAYYQGIVDGIQILEGLGIVHKSGQVKKILKKVCK